ncbi:MAG TPA: hypothetical protein G4O07_05860 [Dehalococcoidia bacterium]|nr:hypothetical protein [Dehalococcoidia bacterium]
MEREEEKVLVPVRRIEAADDKELEEKLEESTEIPDIRAPLRWRVY